MSEITGQNIKDLRKKCGITQEELGQIIGVTTQAVSKWERGGTPDAELLPRIADALGTTIDSIFGRDNSASLESMITHELCTMNQKNAFGTAFRLCWAIQTGLTGKLNLADKFSPDMLDDLHDEGGNAIFSWLMRDHGMTDSRLSMDGRYYFIMPEPPEGFAGFLKNIEKLSGIFEIMSDKNVLKIISYMFSRKNTPVSLSLIASKIGLDESLTSKLMEKLKDAGLVDCTIIETETGNISTYTYRREFSLIPFFVFARELGENSPIVFVGANDRLQPLF